MGNKRCCSCGESKSLEFFDAIVCNECFEGLGGGPPEKKVTKTDNPYGSKFREAVGKFFEAGRIDIAIELVDYDSGYEVSINKSPSFPMSHKGMGVMREFFEKCDWIGYE